MKKLRTVGKTGYSVYFNAQEFEVVKALIDCTKYKDSNGNLKQLKIAALVRHLICYVSENETRFQEFATYLKVDPTVDAMDKIGLLITNKKNMDKLMEIHNRLLQTEAAFTELIYNTCYLEEENRK